MIPRGLTHMYYQSHLFYRWGRNSYFCELQLLLIFTQSLLNTYSLHFLNSTQFQNSSLQMSFHIMGYSKTWYSRFLENKNCMQSHLMYIYSFHSSNVDLESWIASGAGGELSWKVYLRFKFLHTNITIKCLNLYC